MSSQWRKNWIIKNWCEGNKVVLQRNEVGAKLYFLHLISSTIFRFIKGKHKMLGKKNS